MCAFVLKQPLSKKDLSVLSERFSEADPESIDLLVRWLICSTDLEHYLNSHFAQFSTSQARFSCLMTIYRSPDHCVKPIDIAERLGVTRGNMTGLLDNLEKDGLITREDDPKDRRINYVKLSKKGTLLLKSILPMHFLRIKELTNCLSKNEQKVFLTCIEKMNHKINDMHSLCNKKYVNKDSE